MAFQSRDTLNQRVLRGSQAIIAVTLIDQDGATRDAVGALSVTVLRGNGTTVSTGAAVEDTANQGRYTYQLTAANTALLDLFTVTWTEASGGVFVNQVEVVGAYFFNIEEVRASDPIFVDTVKYPTADIVRTRQEVEEQCEFICKQAWVPRYKKITIDGSGTFRLQLPDPNITAIRSMANAGRPMTPSELASLIIDPYGEIRLPGGIYYGGNPTNFFYNSPGSVVTEYEYGTQSPPADLKRAALAHLRYLITRPTSAIPDRATTISSDGGTFQLATAGRAGFETGLPEIDAVYLRYQAQVVSLA